jgi:hypothetical protein
MKLFHIYDPETKEQSKERRNSGSLRPKTFMTQKSSSKVLASVFWEKDGILLADYLEMGATITVKYYIALLEKMRQQLSPNVETSFLKESRFFKTILVLTWRTLHARYLQVFTLKF